jgi:hypothetical protein
MIPADAVDWSKAIRPLNLEHVDRLAGATALPAVKVWEYETGRYLGIDGYHRWSMCKHRGVSAIPAVVRTWPNDSQGQKAFDFECLQANLQHGLPLSREERDRAIVRIWSRWGRIGERSNGETLERLGELFNLTKQRIHQIVSTPHSVTSGAAERLRRWRHEEDDDEPAIGPSARTLSRPGRFSSLGRFSAAARRLQRLLGDTDFMTALLRNEPSVKNELQQLRALLDRWDGVRDCSARRAM